MREILRHLITVVATFCLLVLSCEHAIGQVRKGAAAYGGWQDDKPEVRRLRRPEDASLVARPTYAVAQVVRMDDRALRYAPDGLSVQLVMSKLHMPRVIRLAPNGDLFVLDSLFNTVRALRIRAGTRKPTRREVFPSGLQPPFGIAFYLLGSTQHRIHIANSDGGVRIALSADGNRLFLSVGSGSNAPKNTFPEPPLTVHPAPRIATCLRNCDGISYGWPWYYMGGREGPRLAGARPALIGNVTIPEVLMPAQSAPLQMVFYQRGNISSGYQGSAFAAMDGSWNRGKRTGEYEDFMTGSVPSDGGGWGCPVGVAVAKNGALLETEDGNGTIWRVTYGKNIR